MVSRRDELLTKVYEGHADPHIYILVDCSASMSVGRPSKLYVAQQVAAAIGYAALVNMDRLGVAAFADGLVAALPPLCHHTRLPRLLQFLDSLTTQGRQTDLARSVESFVRRRQRPGPVVIVSDMYDIHGFQRGLEMLRYRGYEPRLVQVQDPREIDPQFVGDVEIFDVETGAVRQVTVTQRMVARYRQLVGKFQDSLCTYSPSVALLTCVWPATCRRMR